MLKYYFRLAVYVFVATAFGPASADAYLDFFRAIDIDDVRTVKGLLARGFDPNSPNEKGQPALYVALRDEAPRVAAALLAHPDLKVDATTAANETPLMMAALKGDVAWTQRLIERGGQINRPGWTPLHYAASGPEPKVVALLLDRGAAIDALSPNRSTPLMMAAGYGDQQSADLLLLRGADPRLRNDVELAAADFARNAGRDALAAKLAQAAR
ncbi:MAG: ankyrin repeat domain-containing protein [Chitinophagaceae bacterium]|nr:ankyrin repeat domain-containing protein [Rubrivivax sp.]